MASPFAGGDKSGNARTTRVARRVKRKRSRRTQEKLDDLAEALVRESREEEVPQGYRELLQPVLPSNFSWDAFVEASRRGPRTCVRINKRKATSRSIAASSSARGWHLAECVPWADEDSVFGGGYWVGKAERKEGRPAWAAFKKRTNGAKASSNAEEEQPYDWPADPAYHFGHLYVQDAASLLPVAALTAAFDGGVPPQGVRVLDMAAAPGGKASALTSWVAEAGGLLVANEPTIRRASVMVSNLQRQGLLPWTALTMADGRKVGRYWSEEFDAVLLDAPCSGDAMTREGEYIGERLGLSDEVRKMAQNQRQMIASAFCALRPGGVLVYSTCTLNSIENEEVMNHLERIYGGAVERLPLDDIPGVAGMVTEDGYLRVWPQDFNTSGFFVARVRKVLSVTPPVATIEQPWLESKGMDLVSETEADQVKTTFKAMFNWWPQDDYAELRRRGKEIWLCPKDVGLLRPAGLRRSGICLARCSTNPGMKTKLIYRAHHEWVQAFGHEVPEGFGYIAWLGADAAKQFCFGTDQVPEWGVETALARPHNQVIARYDDFILGHGLWEDGIVQSDVPAAWRSDRLSF